MALLMQIKAAMADSAEMCPCRTTSTCKSLQPSASSRQSCRMRIAARRLEMLLPAPPQDRPSDRIHALRIAAGELAERIGQTPV